MATGQLASGRRPTPRRDAGRGHSVLELLLVASLLAVLSVAAVPGVLVALDGTRARGAARYFAARLHQARLEAVKRSTHVGMRIDSAAGYRYALYVDGNGDGVRTSDIRAGIDRMLGSAEQIDAQFSGISFGILDRVTAVDSHELLGAGADPVRLGASDILSFGPLGTATAGTLYLRGRGREQYAVRVLGVTGRIRVLRFDFASGEWVSP